MNVASFANWELKATIRFGFLPGTNPVSLLTDEKCAGAVSICASFGRNSKCPVYKWSSHVVGMLTRISVGKNCSCSLSVNITD